MNRSSGTGDADDRSSGRVPPGAKGASTTAAHPDGDMPGADTSGASQAEGDGRRSSAPNEPDERPPQIHGAIARPESIPVDAAADFPETFRYRLKNRLLGQPLTTERLAVERLGRPTALAVLSSDVISSSAYATEEALIPLVQVVGIAAFSLIIPVTIAVIVVLAFVTLSYLEVVKVYTKAGGAYVVSRENFGPRIAQIAAMSLLVDYTLTVAVSVAAGVAALTSVFPALTPATTWISVGLVVLICYANLRGVREAGRLFAVPTYFFVVNMAILIAVGAFRAFTGHLAAHSVHVANAFHLGHAGSGLFYGAGLFVILRSFASGGSALTGTEAISNGVSVFRRPESTNARITMMWMAMILGSLVLGMSALASITHPVPRTTGTPTVIAQIARDVYGHGGLGTTGFVLLQAGTMLILVLAANTSFTGFPFLASFAAADSYLPRALNRRGHRLVFSVGILSLTVVSILLLIVTNAQVDALIPLYAVGVFTGFTMAGFGMLRHHLREHEPHWRRSAVINGTAGVLSGIVDVIIIVTKFTEGAWAIVVIIPVGFAILLRLHHQYTLEEKELEVNVGETTESPPLRRHAVIVLVDALDIATARAIQYARTLSPDDLRAVHFDIDSRATRALESEWRRLGFARLPLDIVEVPDRRLGRAALELVAETVADGDTQCTLLLPRRGFVWGWQRLLHDRTADKIANIVSQVPHVAATIVPYNLSGKAAFAKKAGASPAAIVERLGRAGSSRARRRVEGGDVPSAQDVGSDARPEPAAAGRGESGPAPRSTTTLVKPAASPGGPDDGLPGFPARPGAGGRGAEPQSEADRALARRSVGTSPIGNLEWRHRVRVAGRVRSVRVQPRGGTSNLECTLVDRTGQILLVFQGRPRIPGIEPGARLVAEGMVGSWGRRLAILNPDYELVAEREQEDPLAAGPPEGA